MRLEKKSVKERRFNKKLYEKIFKITSKPDKILDLGCGLSPLYFPYNDIYYIATDINNNILKKVKKYFKKNKIKNNVFYLDINDLDEIKKIEDVDVVFSFKVFDIFKRNKKLAIEVIRNLKTKFIVVSFATKTSYGKKMKNPKRKWFENILKKLDYEYTTIKFYNEIFYVVKK